MPRGTQGIPRVQKKFRIRAYHPLWKTFPDPSATSSDSHIGTLQPPALNTMALKTPRAPLLSAGFGLLRVRSPLLAESLLISIPPGTEMFQFPRFASLAG